MAKQHKKLKDRLQKRFRDNFIGREYQIQLFQQNLDRSPENSDFVNIFNIYGQGGVGKTNLIKKYIELAKSKNALTAYTDEGVRSIVDWLASISKQMEQQDAPFKNFDKYYKIYIQYKQLLEADPEAPKVNISSVAKTVTKEGIKAIHRIPGSEIAMEFVDDNSLANQVGEWTEFVRKKIINKDEVQLVIKPEAVLTPLFLEDIFQYAEKRPIAFFIDTYEITGIFLDTWLRRLLEDYDVPENLMLVIAGRDELNPNDWSDFSSLLQVISLKEFTEEEAHKYLEQQQITDPDLIQSIITISGRLPVLLTALAEIAPKSAEDIGDISDTAVERFLKWVDDPIRRKIALAAALPRRLNQDILAVLAPEGNAGELFDWLHRMSFVQVRGEHWTYHPIVREQMLNYKRRLSPTEWSLLHEKLAAFYEAKQHLLNITDRKKGFEDKEWRDLILEITYHRLEAEPKLYLKPALHNFIDAWNEIELDNLMEWAMVFPTHLICYGTQSWQNILKKGITGYVKKDYDEVLYCLNIISSYLPNNSLIWSSIGDLFFRRGDYDKAIENYKKAIEINYEDSRNWSNVGNVYLRKSEHDKALESYQKALELNPENSLYWNLIGRVYYYTRDFNKAIEYFQKAVNIESDVSLFWNDLGNTFNNKNDYNKAIEAYNKAIDLEPENASYWNNLGTAWNSKNDYKRAIEYFQKAIDLKIDNSISWNNLGNAWSSINDFNKALESYQKAIEIDPNDADYWNNLGNTWNSKNDYDKAIECHKKAIDLNPENSYSWSNLASVLSKVKLYFDAIKASEKAIELNPQNIEAWYQKGIGYFSVKDYLKAIEALEKSIEINPGYWDAIIELGYIYHEINDLEKAIEFFDLAIQINPSSVLSYKAKLLILSQLDKLDDIEGVLNQARGKIVDKKDYEILADLDNQLREAIIEQGSTKIFEAKVIIVGAPYAGKTTLIKKLKNPNYPVPCDEKSTHGIDIHHYTFYYKIDNQVEKIISNIWDFGGQEIYYDTHQFFLTPQALYILVIDTRKDETAFEWWLHTISLLSKESPILIVVNEKEDRIHHLLETQLKNHFKNIKKIITVNFANCRGLKSLEEAVQEQIVSLKHFGKELPSGWVKVKQKLSREKRSFIDFDTFLNFCFEENITEEEEISKMSNQFHQLGYILHYQDDPFLEDLIILNPNWITEAAYDLLIALEKCEGNFTFEDARKIWKEKYPRNKHRELLNLISRFKLCYKIENTKSYIVPQLLPKNKLDYQLPLSRSLDYQYEYSFMPKGILSRFIVQIHPKIKNKLVWLNGVVIADGNTEAEIIENRFERKIKIRVFGQRSKELLYFIRENLFNIHQGFLQLEYVELLPCICSECRRGARIHYFSKENIEKARMKKRATLPCEISYEDILLDELLDNSITLFDFNLKNFREYIENSDLGGFFKEIKKARVKNILRDEITSLTSRYNKLEDERGKGIIDDKFYFIESSNLIVNCISFLEKIERSSKI